MSKLQSQRSIIQTSQLLYRPSGRKTASCQIIRSKKTAELLSLSDDVQDDQRHAFEAGASAAKAKTLRPGGFLRSRMTAELLGVDLIGH